MNQLCVWILLLVIARPAWAETQVCLRFKGTPLAQISRPDCSDRLGDLERQTRTSQLMVDYEVFLDQQERNAKLAWRTFTQKALQKNWSSEDESLMMEVTEWAKRQKWKMDPQFDRQLQQLESRQELRLTRKESQGSWIEQLAQLPGWEDLVLLTPVGDGESVDQVLADPRSRRWVIYSSVFRPQVFWGQAKHLGKALSAAQDLWVESSCREPVFRLQTAQALNFRAWDPQGCATANLARGPVSTRSQEPFQGLGSESAAPQLEKPRSNNWIWWSLLAGAAAAYSLRDKTVVITHGFGGR